MNGAEQVPAPDSPGPREGRLGAPPPARGAGRRLLRSATTVSTLTALGVAAGFLVDILLVARFGIGASTDAFWGGYTLPIILVTCLMALNPVLVTILAGTQGDRSAFSVLWNAAGLLSLVVALAGALLAGPLVQITTPGFAPATAAQAVGLARILFARVPAAALAEVCKAELFAQRRFGLAVSSNVLPNLVTVVLLVVPAAGWGIEIVAFGLVAGTLAQAVLLSCVLFGPLRMPYRSALHHSMPLLRNTGRLMLAPLAGLLLRQGVTLAERFFGSHLSAGSVTALSYANRLTMTAGGVALDSIATASLPALAEQWRLPPTPAARHELGLLLKFMASVAAPLGLMVAALGTPLTLLFFERGQVDHESALLLGTVLSVYSLSLPFLGPYRAVQTFFYAVQKTIPIVVLHGSLTALVILLDIALVGPLGAAGLALSFALSSALIAAVSVAWLAGRAGDLGWPQLLASFWRLCLASGAAAAVAYAVNYWFGEAAVVTGRWGLVLHLTLSGVAGLAVFVLVGGALRLEVLAVLKGLVREQWAKRRPAGS